MRREFTVNGYPVREITPYTAKTGYRKYGEHAFLYETPDGVLTIALAEEVYRLPIKDRLLQK